MEKIARKAFGRSTMVSILEKLGFEAPKKGEIEFECYDVSHTDGHFTVASRVVMTNGKPNPAKYRKYKIRSLSEGEIDDFASMREVLYRRTLEGLETGNFPTMFLIDGGKGQLSSAREGIERAMAEWKTRADSGSNPPAALRDAVGFRSGIRSLKPLVPPLPFLASLAKREEEIFTESREGSVKFSKGSAELAVVTGIRDEAHRFAITFNRKARSKEMRKNVLEELP
jgi:excinuclease ABC subunit C